MRAIPSPQKLEKLRARAKAGSIIPTGELAWLASIIDHTLLKPEAGEEQVSELCAEAKKFHFASVCVYPKFIPLCRKLLKGSGVMSIAVVGFPTGLESSEEKAAQATAAIRSGAEEIDMVINTSKLRARKHRTTFLDIRRVVRACGPVPVKVILETSLLTDEEKIMACALCKAAGAAFVKTSTGFVGSGATTHDVQLMRNAVGRSTGVKASGGIRTLADALEMVAAGANRLGCSAGVAIISGKSATQSGY